MKTFWATLAAILVAAVVIALFIEAKSHFEAVARAKARTAAIKAEEAEETEREKEAADFRKAHGLPTPIYPTLEEAFASPTPSPY